MQAKLPAGLGNGDSGRIDEQIGGPADKARSDGKPGIEKDWRTDPAIMLAPFRPRSADKQRDENQHTHDGKNPGDIRSPGPAIRHPEGD